MPKRQKLRTDNKKNDIFSHFIITLKIPAGKKFKVHALPLPI